ncbi:MAG: class II glutamine amidotransferase, partial [bacterium]|nr:class II glutamine amidotransferase [bacterium]
MCGIVGYLGKKQAAPLLLEGLRRLEYRGYDSAGLSVANDKNGIATVKAVGKIDVLANLLEKKMPEGSWGIAHTRWATHGAVTEKNAHPHFDCRKNIFLVHNGIIENYRQLKEKLIKEGHKFVSETDTEILAHLIEKF